jgi:S-formylglutathione hydrolase FrmB
MENKTMILNFAKGFMQIIFVGILVLTALNVTAQIDTSHYSQAFQAERSYRVYLPTDYNTNVTKSYPVIYYFHGWGGRYKWDIYDVSDDPQYPGNGRVKPPYVMEWKAYAQTHDVIIVTMDGYEPNLHPGNKTREGIRYSDCDPYDFPRAHDSNIKQWGWDFKMYFREMVADVDNKFRTIADRDHRAVTGLSMGGLTSLYISGQNKDLLGSVSAFCPADNEPMYGPKGYLSVFTNLEMYRSLKGLSMRLSANDGDWLYSHDIQMKRIFEGSGFQNFEFHLADFPDHWAADINEQLDFHMAEFQKIHPQPNDWSHICPSFKTFDQWGYNFTIERTNPAITILENMSKKHMKIYSRTFIPDGPIVKNETIHVKTDAIYSPSADNSLISYCLSDKLFISTQLSSSADGKLEFDLSGGGNIVGVSGSDIQNTADIRLVGKELKDYLYFEANKQYSLGFDVVNIGNETATNITVKAVSNHPYLVFTSDENTLPDISSAELLSIDSMFTFSFDTYDEEHLAGNILIEISVNGQAADTQKVVFFATPESPLLATEDVIILDGRTQQAVPFFNQGSNSVTNKSISGGSGNGNGIPEAGEELLVYIKLPQGLSPKDKNTFHKTYLIGDNQDPYITVNRLKYEEKKNQAATTGIYTYLKVADTVPKNHEFKLWFRVESLYNDKNVAASRATVYRFHYDYRRVKLTANTHTLNIETDGFGSIHLSPEGGNYLHGSSVTLSAYSSEGYKFANWGGDLSGNENPTTIIMDSDKLVTASFIPLPAYKLNISIIGHGLIIVSDTADEYVEGTQLTLIARPDDGYGFDHWSGDLRGSFQIKSLVMDNNKEVTATFVQTSSVPTVTAETTLFKVAPNPFSNNVFVSYHLSQSANVQLIVMNSKGEKVQVLVNEKQQNGDFELQWNGVDLSGKDVSIGIYYCMLQIGQQRLVKKIIKI